MRRVMLAIVMVMVVGGGLTAAPARADTPSAGSILSELRKVAVSVDAQHDRVKRAVLNPDAGPDERRETIRASLIEIRGYVPALQTLLNQIDQYGQVDASGRSHHEGAKVLRNVELTLVDYTLAEIEMMGAIGGAIRDGATDDELADLLASDQRAGARADFITEFNRAAEAVGVRKLY
jgi:hypothetical protein